MLYCISQLLMSGPYLTRWAVRRCIYNLGAKSSIIDHKEDFLKLPKRHGPTAREWEQVVARPYPLGRKSSQQRSASRNVHLCLCDKLFLTPDFMILPKEGASTREVAIKLSSSASSLSHFLSFSITYVRDRRYLG